MGGLKINTTPPNRVAAKVQFATAVLATQASTTLASTPDSTTLDLDSQNSHDKAATSKYLLVGSVTNCSQACAVGDFVPSCSQVHGVTFCACAFWAISSLSFSAAPDLVTRSSSRSTWARHSPSPLTLRVFCRWHDRIRRLCRDL